MLAAYELGHKIVITLLKWPINCALSRTRAFIGRINNMYAKCLNIPAQFS